jgi:cytochrome b6-f complex iron-sulfur subunit
MNRKKFIEQIGKAGAFVISCHCLAGCRHEVLTASQKNVDFTIDLSDSRYQNLSNEGGFVYENGILIAHTIHDQYIATDAKCTHEESLVAYYPSDIIFCGKHGSSFATDGSVIQGPAAKALKTYKTQLAGNKLRIYS